ncbi:hypothetical protein Leryth_018015 [Lithospermum erythrorhizon]|nr:hypothetical protein Leryth_018015 [Lithospermum erythrorhizon]
MAATIATTMAMLNAKCISSNTNKYLTPSSKATPKPTMQNLPKGLKKLSDNPSFSIPLSGTALAGAIFSTLATSDAAFAAQQIADLAEGSDNRGLALLLPIIPAIAWVLFNILQPALNQINRMRTKGVIVGLGLGGLAASEFLMHAPEASAAAEAAANDNRGQLLLFVVAPAILWVLYNILQPALNQINRMRS